MKKVNYETALKEAIESFNGDEAAAKSLLNKYAIHDDNKIYIETTLIEVKQRLISEMRKIDEGKKYNYEFLLEHFLPGGRVLYGLGNPYDGVSTLANCYVDSIEDDSIKGIFDIAYKQAKIFSRGGGIGFDISPLRPIGAKVNNSAKTTSGSVSFMDLYSTITGLIGQCGRRGALMLMIDCNHPDLIDFIKIKGGKDKTKVQYANISVKITNKFMQAVEHDDVWEMTFTTKNNDKIVRKEKATNIWNLLVESNWKGAEPGILFWDNVINDDPASIFPETKAVGTNPCGEQALEKGGNCNLGSLNVSSFVLNPFTDKASFDFKSFTKCIRLAVRFLDNINMVNKYRQPLEINKKCIELGNRIGLGFTGLADALIKLNIKYDSDQSIKFCKKLTKKLKINTIKASIDLVKERGICGILEKYKGTSQYNEWIEHSYFKSLPKKVYKELKKYGARHIGFNTIAPSGTLSIVMQCSSGIEPVFALSYDRTTMQARTNGKQETFQVYYPLIKQYNEIYGKDAHLKNEIFITSEDINWEKRIQLQSVIQENISQSISSTINIPEDVSKEVISDIYKTAWKMKLKGITIYRAGSRDGILKKIDKKIEVLDTVKFPEETKAIMRVIKSENRKWYVTYSIDDETNLPNSLFVNTNSSEKNILTENVLEHLIELGKTHIKQEYIDKLENKCHLQSNVTRIARTLSLLLRHRIPIIEIVQTIDSIQPPVYSFIYQIKKILAMYLDGQITAENCPECSTMIRYEGGCLICPGCGYSKC